MPQLVPLLDSEPIQSRTYDVVQQNISSLLASCCNVCMLNSWKAIVTSRSEPCKPCPTYDQESDAHMTQSPWIVACTALMYNQPEQATDPPCSQRPNLDHWLRWYWSFQAATLLLVT
jgi:hypothetical protein